MVRNPSLKLKAIQLRKRGKSYLAISKYLDVPKSTLSDWFSKHSWSQIIKTKLDMQHREQSRIIFRKAGLARAAAYRKIFLEARRQAKIDFPRFYQQPLFSMGLGIFWGEGKKTSKYSISVVNTDPDLIEIFRKFLVQFFAVEPQKIRAYLTLYPDLEEKNCIGYWIAKTNLTMYNFNKSVVIQGKHPTRRLPYGICTITYSGRAAKETLDVWLDLVARQLNNKRV